MKRSKVREYVALEFYFNGIYLYLFERQIETETDLRHCLPPHISAADSPAPAPLGAGNAMQISHVGCSDLLTQPSPGSQGTHWQGAGVRVQDPVRDSNPGSQWGLCASQADS